MNKYKWVRVIPALMLTGILAACGASASSTTTPKPSVHVSVIHSTPSLRDQLRTWVDGTGGSDWKQVNKDVDQLSTDASANNESASEADGAVLASDAQNAASVPIPGPARNAYVMAMNAYADAGTAASSADWTTAGADVRAGNTFLGRVEQSLKEYGG